MYTRFLQLVLTRTFDAVFWGSGFFGQQCNKLHIILKRGNLEFWEHSSFFSIIDKIVFYSRYRLNRYVSRFIGKFSKIVN